MDDGCAVIGLPALSAARRGVARDDDAFLQAAGHDRLVRRSTAPSATSCRSQPAAALHHARRPARRRARPRRAARRARPAYAPSSTSSEAVRSGIRFGLAPLTSTSTTKLRTFGDSVDCWPIGEICVTRAGERQVGIGVEADADRLADLQLVDVGLVDAGADAHRRRD